MRRQPAAGWSVGGAVQGYSYVIATGTRGPDRVRKRVSCRPAERDAGGPASRPARAPRSRFSAAAAGQRGPQQCCIQVLMLAGIFRPAIHRKQSSRFLSGHSGAADSEGVGVGGVIKADKRPASGQKEPAECHRGRGAACSGRRKHLCLRPPAEANGSGTRSGVGGKKTEQEMGGEGGGGDAWDHISTHSHRRGQGVG